MDIQAAGHVMPASVPPTTKTERFVQETHQDLAPGRGAFITTAELPPSGEGPLNGWRIAVKDNIDVEGLPTTGGTAFLSSNIARSDAEVVSRLRRAGAIIVGKTNMHELGHGVTGINPTYGTTAHPHAPGFTVGGSSGGSALAVLLGEARAALGTDTGGSVRIPASYCGLIGYRPSADRYPTTGLIGISSTRDAVGLIARDVEDIRDLDAAITGIATHRSTPADPVRLGILQETLTELQPDQRALLDGALANLVAHGIVLDQIVESRNLTRCFELGLTVLSFETLASIRAYLSPRCGPGALNDLIESTATPDTRAILQKARDAPISPEEYSEARKELTEIKADFDAVMAGQKVDVIVYPTVAVRAPHVTRLGDWRHEHEQLESMVLNSTPATLFGTPAISIPLPGTTTEGLSFGITLEHLGGDDDALISAAQVVQHALSPQVVHRTSTAGSAPSAHEASSQDRNATQ